MRLVPPLSEPERAEFIAAALRLRDVPFRHTGRSVRGVDCVGLVALALTAVGRQVADRADYSRNPIGEGLRDVLVAHLGEPVSEMQPGDVVLMRWHESGGVKLFNHVGIVTAYPLGGLALLHAHLPNRRVVWHRLADPWPRRIVEVFRP